MIDAQDEERLRKHFRSAFGEAPNAARRVEELVLPMLHFARDVIARGAPAGRAPRLGLSGAQGSGKSTLAAQVVEGLALLGERAVAISIDDFYLTRAQQLALAAAHPGSRVLEHRGYPGTHDVALGARTLDALVRLALGERMQIPSYDKGAFAGRGDRRPEVAWPEVTGPLDLVVLEGWMLGFEPVSEEALDDAALLAPNRALATYAAWHDRLDAFAWLDVADLEAIVAFRVDAERRRRVAGEEALSDAEAEDYIRRFLPAYRTWVPPLRARCQMAADLRPTLHIAIGRDRLPARHTSA